MRNTKKYSSDQTVKLFPDFFSLKEWNTLQSILSQPCWQFGHQSTPDSKPFWIMELDDEEWANKMFLLKIRRLLGKTYALQRVYANGTTYGQEGALHQDSQNPMDRTFLIYGNSEWKEQWGGATYIDGYGTIIPKPNLGVLFPGNMFHRAYGPNKEYEGLRVTIAYKLIHNEKLSVSNM